MSLNRLVIPVIAATCASFVAACSGTSSTAPAPAATVPGSTTPAGTILPTIVARVDSTSSVNRGTTYYPSWESVWYVGGHKLNSIVAATRESNATRVHSVTGAVSAGDCILAAYFVSSGVEYAQDIKLEAPSACK